MFAPLTHPSVPPQLRRPDRFKTRGVTGRGDTSPPPNTDDDPEAAVYAALDEAPEGTLPHRFAEQGADRVGLSPESGTGWAEIPLLLLIIAGAGAGLVWRPPRLAGLQRSLGELVLSLQPLAGAVRGDVILASTLVFFLAVGLDALFRRWRPDPSPRSSWCPPSSVPQTARSVSVATALAGGPTQKCGCEGVDWLLY